MNYKLIDRSARTQPDGDDWTKWKEQIAKDCHHQCVYCSIHEHPWGGIDHYQIDHYRPKSIPEFKKYILDILNLFYACPVCNRFKSDDWPEEPKADLSTPSYPDPSIINYSVIFEIDGTNYKLKGRNVAASYMIDRLFLNRPQLIYERREASLIQKESQLRKSLLEMVRKVNDIELTNRLLLVVDKLLEHKNNRHQIRPYKLSEIRK